MQPKNRLALLLALCVIAVYAAHIVRHYDPDYTWAKDDPNWQVWTAVSLVEDGDLDLRNQLRHDPGKAEDQTARGKRGEWYPLHEFLMPALAMGFYRVFSYNGCLYFNFLISVLLVLAVYYLCARHVEPLPAFAAASATAFSSLLVTYTYSFSLDVFGTLLLVLAYWVTVEDRFLLGGFTWGVAVFGRLANGFTAPAFCLYLLLRGVARARREDCNSRPRAVAAITPALRFGLGGVPVALAFLLSNFLMFGHPLHTAYRHWQKYDRTTGSLELADQAGEFNRPLGEGLKAMVLDKENGLLVGAPLLIPALLFGWREFWNKARHEALLFLAVSLCLLVVYARFRLTFPGAHGNRYLMAVACLSAIPLALAIRNWAEPFVGENRKLPAGPV